LRLAAEVAAQPLLHRAAEALLRASEGGRRQRVAHGFAQHVLAVAIAVLDVRWERHRELDELMVQERLSAFDGARHRDAVHAREQQLGEPLPELEVGHALEEVGVLAVGSTLVPNTFHRPQRVGVLASQHALLERPTEAQGAAPVRDAAVAGVVERLAVADRPARASGRMGGDGADRRPHCTRDEALERHHDAPMVDVAFVAVEELVRSLADLDHDRAGLPGQPRDEVLRYRRPIRQRLVLVVDELGHELAHRRLVDEDLVMVGAEVPGDGPCVTELVVARVPARRRRVGAHRNVGELGHQRDVRRGVQSSRQEDPEGDVGHHAPADRLPQTDPHLGDHLGLAHLGDLVADGWRGHRVPPRAALDLPLRRHRQQLSGAELRDAGEHRARRRREAEGQVIGERLLVELPGRSGVLEDRLDLGAEEHAVWQDAVVQRLDAEPVADEQQRPPARVPDREGEHPLEALHAGRALLLVEVDDRLGVGSRAKAMSALLQLGAQRGVVVDLAVVGNPDRVVLV
jgi:hypothetical protein